MERSDLIASAAVGVSVLSIAIAIVFGILNDRRAKHANATAEKAIREAKRSADAAERSAVAAEGSVEIQEREARAIAEQRQRAREADVRPVKWMRSAQGISHANPRGFQLRNYGEGIAHKAWGEFRRTDNDQAVRTAEIERLAGGDLVGLNGGEAFPLPDPDSVPIPNEREVAARAIWTDEDGDLHETEWEIYPRE